MYYFFVIMDLRHVEQPFIINYTNIAKELEKTAC